MSRVLYYTCRVFLERILPSLTFSFYTAMQVNKSGAEATTDTEGGTGGVEEGEGTTAAANKRQQNKKAGKKAGEVAT